MMDNYINTGMSNQENGTEAWREKEEHGTFCFIWMWWGCWHLRQSPRKFIHLDLQHGFVEKIGDVWEVFSTYNNLTWNKKYKELLFNGLEDNGFYIDYISKEGNITAYNRDIEHYIFIKIEGGAKDE